MFGLETTSVLRRNNRALCLLLRAGSSIRLLRARVSSSGLLVAHSALSRLQSRRYHSTGDVDASNKTLVLCRAAAYYFNATTGVTSWDRPVTAVARAAPAPPPRPAAPVAVAVPVAVATPVVAAAPAAGNGGGRGGFLAEISAGKNLKKTSSPAATPGAFGGTYPFKGRGVLLL